MSKSERLDELVDEIVKVGNTLAGGAAYSFDAERERLETSEGRKELIRYLNTDINTYSIAAYYDDDNEDIKRADKVIGEIKALDAELER